MTTMQSPAEEYLDRCAQLMATVHSQLGQIQTAADWFAETILAGQMVHVFGSGHSRILTEEMWPRYGSFPGFNPIVELSLTFHNLVVGANVTIGHRAFLHGCTVGDGSMIANGAMVLDRSRIGRNCVVAAGALIPPDKEIPDGSVVMGAPGKIVREVSTRDLTMIARAADSYRRRAEQYRNELKPDPRG